MLREKKKTNEPTTKPSAIPTRCSQRICRQTCTDCKLAQQSSQSIQALKSLHLFKSLNPQGWGVQNPNPSAPQTPCGLQQKKTDYSLKTNKTLRYSCSFSRYSARCFILFISTCLGLTGRQVATRQGLCGQFDCFRSSLLPPFCSTAHKKLPRFGGN